jgi:hypothetical protein
MPTPTMCEELCVSVSAHSALPVQRSTTSTGMVDSSDLYWMTWPPARVTVLASRSSAVTLWL